MLLLPITLIMGSPIQATRILVIRPMSRDIPVLPARHEASLQSNLPSGWSDESDLLHLYLLRFDRTSTREAYRHDISEFFEGSIVPLKAARQVTFVHTNLYVQYLQEKELKSSTIRRKVSAIRGFFDWLIALGLVDTNPAHRQVIRRVHRNSHGERDIAVLTQEQARRLYEAAGTNGRASVRDRALIMTLLHCALRRSEAAAMDVEHLRTVGPYWVLDLPETKGGIDQTVKVPARVVEAIQEVCEHYGIASGAIWRSFSRNSLGHRLTDRSVYGIVDRTARKAGLDIGAHTLRHTACTLAIEGGATPQQVQTHARHKKLETTMQYVHQRDKLRDNASDYINF